MHMASCIMPAAPQSISSSRLFALSLNQPFMHMHCAWSQALCGTQKKGTILVSPMLKECMHASPFRSTIGIQLCRQEAKRSNLAHCLYSKLSLSLLRLLLPSCFRPLGPPSMQIPVARAHGRISVHVVCVCLQVCNGSLSRHVSRAPERILSYGEKRAKKTKLHALARTAQVMWGRTSLPIPVSAHLLICHWL